MDQQTGGLLALVGLIVIVALVGFTFFKLVGNNTTQAGPAKPAARQQEEEDDEVEAQAQGGRRGAADRMRAGRLRQRAAARAGQQQQQQQAVAARDDSDSEAGSGSEDESGEEGGEPGRPRTRKERAREARREAREAERAAREARENKTSAYDERRRAKETEREAKERAQEEEMKRAAEEKAKAEEEEADKWMSMISVEQEGTGEAEDAEESQGLLGQFIDYIKARKTVPLEQIATEFKLRTTDVIDRIHGLEAMGRLTGVMDERGKYIYISLDEMKAFANYLLTRGRVPIGELASKSASFIDLEAKAADPSLVPGRPVIDFDTLLDGQEAAVPAA